MAYGSEEIMPFVWAKDRDSKTGGVTSTQKVKPVRQKEEPDLWCCGSCNHAITETRNAISVVGNHSHRFMNRAGFLFEIGCFGQAPGCDHQGVPEEDYSWFPDYTWRFALCAQCHAHLGWRFDGDGTGFWGLIFERLVQRLSDS